MARVDLLSESGWLCVARKRLRSDGLSEAASGSLKFLGVRPAAEKGEFAGFSGDSLPVRVRVQLDDGSEEELGFFIKTLPLDCEAHTEMANDVFHKEVVLYGEFFPCMEELPQPAEDEEQRYFERWGPRAFFTRPDLIVMEDLIVQGFVEIDRRKPYDFDHVALALEAVARFHASAWLLEKERSDAEGRPTPFDQLFPACAEESLFVEKPTNTLTRWFTGAVRGIQTAIPQIAKYKSSHRLECILNELPMILPLAEELTKKSEKYRNVLNHGDLWANNILFRYGKDGKSGTPTDVRLVDYQLVRYTPPASDINCLIHLTTRMNLRRERGGDMLRCYYHALRNAMARGGENVEDYLTWDELVSSCDDYQPFALITTAAYQHMNLISPDFIKEQLSPENFETFFLEGTRRGDLVRKCFESDDYYREKVSECVTEMVDVVILRKREGFWRGVVESSDEKKEGAWKEREMKRKEECCC